MTTPTAGVLQVNGKYIKVRCPYCNGVHRHENGAVPSNPGTTFHRAPGCGLQRTGDERIAGYTFTIPTA
ncbi:hypothetical protein [Pseudarthrobacter sp. NS4]|uniref:hypothetical protein n=1 Tax=Pseudarthrobacter sp. NS4 TaxID=2973976 RepID=UPI002161228B|nr:hypothetical protein [Pseudarthrobacter sp. NS4]